MELMSPAKARKRYAHGTRARFVFAKCRCFECKVANTNYAFEMNALRKGAYTCHFTPAKNWYVVRRRATGEIVFRSEKRELAFKARDRFNKREAMPCDRDLIDPRPALKHIANLRAAGVGYKTIAARASVNSGVIARIIQGEIRKIRRTTAAAILGVTAQAAPGARVPAAPTWELVDRLRTAGYAKRQIAFKLGRKVGALQIGRHFVKRSQELKIAALYARLWLTDPKLRALSPEIPAGIKLPDRSITRETRKRLNALPLDAFAEGFARLLAS